MRRIKNRTITRKNAKMGKRIRKEIQEKGLNYKNEYDKPDPTAAAAFKGIAYPGKGRGL